MSILDAARRLARRLPGGIEANATRFGVTATTLRHQLAGMGSYVFGLENAELLTQYAIEQGVDNPLEVVNAFAKNCGALVVPLPGLYQNTGSTMEDLAAAAKEFADFVTVCASASADGRVTANELADVQREMAHLIGTSQRVVASLQAIHERDKPRAHGALSAVPDAVRMAP